MTDQKPDDDQSDRDRGDDAHKQAQKEAAKRDCLDKLLFLLFDGTSAACSNFFSICAGYGVSPDEVLGVDDITPLVILNDRLSKHAMSKVEEARTDPRLATKLDKLIGERFQENIEAAMDPEEAELLIRAFLAYGQTDYFTTKEGFSLSDLARQRALPGLAVEIEGEILKRDEAAEIESRASLERAVAKEARAGRTR